MRTIERAPKFRRDYKREEKGKYRLDLDEILTEALFYLTQDLSLPRKFEDHPLKGKLRFYRECHLKPNLILIYTPCA
ncbi:MAG: type II toxin-antitoxin system YafQ family toxin [Alphaproteobacteria bacterium]|nr:type II toxin-antitoxin system YafQ family toxin [Alphaproteobacteria bacterium]